MVKKGPYLQWTTDETKLLIELLVEGVRRNGPDTNNNFHKLTIEGKVLHALNTL